MNICDSLRGCDVQLVDMLIVYFGKNQLCVPSGGLFTDSMQVWRVYINEHPIYSLYFSL